MLFSLNVAAVIVVDAAVIVVDAAVIVVDHAVGVIDAVGVVEDDAVGCSMLLLSLRFCVCFCLLLVVS